MPAIIFRDDDTSFFTPPQRLEALYQRLWEAGASVSLAVVPWVSGDIRVYWTDGNPHDPSIPPAYRGKVANFPIGDNRELCAFLNELARQGLVEICLHGLTHAFYEFITHDRALIRRKLDEGLSRLERAIPAADVQTFVPPYDRLSPAALEELIARGFHICAMSLNLAPLPSLPQISGFDAGKIQGDQALFVCDDYLFSHKRDPAESLDRARRAVSENALTIVCNHYWMFFHPWRARPNPAISAAWSAFLDDALGGVHEITGFDACARAINRP